MGRYRRLGLVLLFQALLWGVFRATGLASHFNPQYLHDQFEQHRLWGLLIFVSLFALGNLIQIPGWLFLVAAVSPWASSGVA